MKLLLAVTAALCLVPAVSEAQTCSFSVCQYGWGYQGGFVDALGPYGQCGHCDGFPTFACSHTLNRCPAGSTLNLSSGQCTWNLCTGGCGGSLPLCDADETYSAPSSSSVTYGVCTISNHGYIAHEVKYCMPGWTLQQSTGQCFKPCQADLIIRRGFLKNAFGVVVTSVPAYQPYYACVEVANVGGLSAGTFYVQGGGLGVPSAPSAPVYGLGAPGSTVVCLRYPTTPSPGTWGLGITADSTNVVPEPPPASNNNFTLSVKVVP